VSLTPFDPDLPSDSARSRRPFHRSEKNGLCLPDVASRSFDDGAKSGLRHGAAIRSGKSF
jgi:hypothetical protein